MLLRDLPWLWLGGGFGGAPIWVVIHERSNGHELLRVRTGREPGAGELILETMQREAADLDRDAFLARWEYRR